MVPVPEPSADHLIVKIDWAGVNFVVNYQRSGLYPNKTWPLGLGMEGSGTIVALPTNAPDSAGYKEREFALGKRVVVYLPGAYSEYLAAPWQRVLPVPDNIDTRTAAAAMLQGLTVISPLNESYVPKKGDTILIHAAAGGSGLIYSQILSSIGVRVIGTTSTKEKAELAKAHGAAEVLVYAGPDKVDIEKRGLELTNGEGVHAIFDGVGKDTWELDFKVVRLLGTIVFVGNASGPVPPFPVLRLSEKNMKITWVSARVPHRDSFWKGFFGAKFKYRTPEGKFVVKSHHWLCLLDNGKLKGLVYDAIHQSGGVQAYVSTLTCSTAIARGISVLLKSFVREQESNGNTAAQQSTQTSQAPQALAASGTGTGRQANGDNVAQSTTGDSLPTDAAGGGGHTQSEGNLFLSSENGNSESNLDLSSDASEVDSPRSYASYGSSSIVFAHPPSSPPPSPDIVFPSPSPSPPQMRSWDITTPAPIANPTVYEPMDMDWLSQYDSSPDSAASTRAMRAPTPKGPTSSPFRAWSPRGSPLSSSDFSMNSPPAPASPGRPQKRTRTSAGFYPVHRETPSSPGSPLKEKTLRKRSRPV